MTRSVSSFVKQLLPAEKMTKMLHVFVARAESNLCRREPYKTIRVLEGLLCNNYFDVMGKIELVQRSQF